MPPKKVRAVFGEENVLQKYGCVKIQANESENTPDSLTHPSGWNFVSFHHKIPNEAETIALTNHLKQTLYDKFESVRVEFQDKAVFDQWLLSDNISVNHFKLRIPPMIFINDIMQMTYIRSDSQGVEQSVSLQADDTLFCWIAQVRHLFRCFYCLTLT